MGLFESHLIALSEASYSAPLGAAHLSICSFRRMAEAGPNPLGMVR